MRALTWLVKLSLVVAAGAVGLAAVVVGIAPQLWRLANAHEQVPIELPEFEDLASETRVLDAAGNEIAVFRLENSQPVSIDDVPEDVIAAVLAVEDKEFYGHKGVNLRSVVRAMLSNVSAGYTQQGASTITQQVVKLEYLAGLERDGRYKLLQARYATMLEKRLSKREILERYLNTVYFGNNAYGIQAAAEIYFGKRVDQLDLVEGALLAGIIKGPSGFDPINEPERARRRFAVVLDRLVEEGLLTSSRATWLAENWPLPEIPRTFPERSVYSRTYFTEALRKYLLTESTILGDTEQERYNALHRGGLTIYTTLDPRLQREAERARAEQLPANYAGIDAALVSLDSRSGAVRAMVGGAGFVPGRSEINMALRPRQTGSAIKIFILAAAVQAGAQADDLIDGTLPCTLPNPGNPREPFEIGQGVSRGPSTLAEMTWLSINCAYARLTQIVGLNRLVDTTYRMGVRSPLQPFASFATGANEITPLDMASGAQSLANLGLHQEPYYVERVTSRRGVVYQHDDPGTLVLTPEAASTVVDILKGVLTRGTARRIGPVEGHPSAGKTGTQDDNTNAWFVGFTRQLTTAVWVGHPDKYLSMVNIPEFVAAGVTRVQGSTFPARIWKAYMDTAHVGLPAEDWPAPPEEPRRPTRLYLPGNECLATSSDRRSNASTTTVPVDDGQSTETTALPPAVYRPVDPGTTIPPDVLDPFHPLTTVELTLVVYDCARGLPRPPPPSTTTTVAPPVEPTAPPTAPPPTDPPVTGTGG